MYGRSGELINGGQVVVFFLEGKRYGIEIGFVNDIYEYMDSVRVPNGEDYIEGIINLRGEVVTIINLKRRLKIDRRKKETSVIICEVNKERVGLNVDDIDGIIRTEKSDEQTRTDSGFIKGFIEKKDKQIIILDLNKIITKN